MKSANVLQQREKAQAFLDIVNLLPAKVEPEDILPGIDTFDRSLVAEPVSAIRYWLERFEKFPAFIEFISGESLTLQHTRYQLFVFRQFRAMTEAILDLGAKGRGERVNTVFRSPENKKQMFYVGENRPGHFNLPCELVSDQSDGYEKPPRLKIEPDHVISTLQGLDPRRFRRCPICKNAFFATRLFSEADKAEYCSKKCGVTHRKQKSRARGK